MLRNRGFSLVRVMVFMGLLGGLSVGMMNMHQGQSKSQKRLEQNYELSAIAVGMQTMFARETSCTGSFQSNVITGGLAKMTSLIHETKDGSSTLRTINSGDKFGAGITL